ncbi:class I SAM-dependent methyltransferase [Clostridium sp. AM58-1XD]|uniref:class I SAM-dependent methyltransferase n=1 Tax=Clostridium sp. AM58-1XD TaxID=2292307 RepID=UPI000E4CC435|nr:class I SAM-dependent methyltransferase [Clostridium sp. AM58-1XD]RGY96546.1 methyltransferase domain-containing protein [Clostridium sp. AM58-1XD]
MERLDFTNQSSYIAIESAIHFNRYFTAKSFVKGKRVLDVACGEGYGSKLLKEWGALKVTGVDISKEAIEIAKENFSGDGIDYIQHSAEELPFENDSFDVVISFETIEHVDSPDKYLSEISRVLKFGGIAMVSCPNDPYYQKAGEPQNPFHKRIFSWFDFAKLTQSHLGDNVDWYFGFALNGFMNVPLTRCTEPEKNEISPKSMQGLFQYSLLDKTALVPHDRYINHWNCNYYLGVWGAKNDLQNATLFPREFFERPEDPNVADTEEWRKKIEKLEQEHLQQLAEIETEKGRYFKEMQSLKEEYRIIEIEMRRTSSLLELANKEEDKLWSRIYSFENHEKFLKDEMKKYQEQAEIAQKDIEIIKKTKGYRMLQKCWRLVDLIKGK